MWSGSEKENNGVERANSGISMGMMEYQRGVGSLGEDGGESDTGRL